MTLAANTSIPESVAITKTGWDKEETEMLFREVESARETNGTLKDVFERVARITGRKPNSIRNYYYNSLKGTTARSQPAFVPFEREEVWNLILSVLKAQAEGMSVRGCTMKMADGDRSKMLRYQNKYRSVIRTNPSLVKSVMAYMKENQIPCFDPYSQAGSGRKGRSGRKPGRPPGNDVVELISGIMDDISGVQGVDVAWFFKGLRQLTKAAVLGSSLETQALTEEAEKGLGRISERERALEAQIATQNETLREQSETMDRLLTMIRQLIKVNRDFLGMNSIIKVSNLSNYISELARSIDDCEKCIRDYA
ncbi:MAG: SANT/Myb-like DNA-binding domain-containing protein [Christensenellales bacterium]